MIRAAILAIVCLVTFLSPDFVEAGVGGCRPSNGTGIAELRLKYFRSLLTSTDSAHSAIRDSLGLKSAGVDRVALVTDNALCRRAAEALNTYRDEAGTSRQVWLYALGDDYAVADPDIAVPPGMDTPIYLFTHDWRYKATLIGI